MHFAPEMERPFYDTSEDRTNLVPSLLQDAPWVQISDAGAGVEWVFFFSRGADRFVDRLDIS